VCGVMTSLSQRLRGLLRFEVFTAVIMKNAVLRCYAVWHASVASYS
jgi:hypothetical protein